MRYHHNSTDWMANPLKAKEKAESDLKEQKFTYWNNSNYKADFLLKKTSTTVINLLTMVC